MSFIAGIACTSTNCDKYKDCIWSHINTPLSSYDFADISYETSYEDDHRQIIRDTNWVCGEKGNYNMFEQMEAAVEGYNN